VEEVNHAAHFIARHRRDPAEPKLTQRENEDLKLVAKGSGSTHWNLRPLPFGMSCSESVRSPAVTGDSENAEARAEYMTTDPSDERAKLVYTREFITEAYRVGLIDTGSRRRIN
jgi:hypothetical protein